MGRGSVIKVPGCAFRPTSYSAYNDVWWFVSPNRLYTIPHSGQTAEFIAPLNFPNGITIKKITIYCLNEVGPGYISVFLFRANLLTGVEEIFAQEVCPVVTGRQIIVLNGPQIKYKTVKNSSYSYSALVLFDQNAGENVQLHEIQITY